MLKSDAERKEEFNNWIQKVDALLDMKYGMGTEDLPNAPWRDWFDGGITPSEARMKYINEEWYD